MNAGTMKLLLHMYCHPLDVRFPYEQSETFTQECRHRLFMDDLINREDQLGEITDRGRFFVEMVLETPLPVQKWGRP